KWKDRKLMESLREAVETYKIDIMLPFVDPAIEIAGKFVARNTTVWSPVVPIRMAHILFDKGEAATLFSDNGIPVPPTYRGGRPKFPLIAKPRHGSASKGIFLVTDVTDFRRVCRMEGYMMEAYIENRVEYTVDAYISSKGKVLCVSPRLRIEVLGGEVTRTRTVDYPELVELSNRVIRDLRLRGPVTLQFIRDETTGSLMLMEINPRLGGGVVCSIHAGADIPRLILEEYMGKTPEPIENVKPGVLICRYFDETVFNA
ncbi:MAG: ATP-grasp domain-containing protein, partial [Duncaniella sp.]|nr:ATP-grasp domain-containing protein [Duncaniella sp.]